MEVQMSRESTLRLPSYPCLRCAINVLGIDDACLHMHPALEVSTARTKKVVIQLIFNILANQSYD